MTRRLLAAFALLLAGASGASAHGERTQEAFLRMRSLLFYDCHWSTDRLRVNEELVVTGRFRVFDDWPVEVLGEPHTVYLNVGIPGPVFARKKVTMNGKSLVSSTSLEIGGDYEFSMTLAGRAPGRYHVHPMINVYGSGPIVGPGKWITVEEGGEPYRSMVTTLTGQTIDLEHFGLGTVLRWHFLWLALAAFWLFFWIRRPFLIPRYLAVRRGAEDQLVSDRDRMVAVGLFVTTIVIVLLGNWLSRRNHPITIPLQSARQIMKPLPRPVENVAVALEEAGYQVPGRTVDIRIRVTNRTTERVRLGEFTTANVRFLDETVMKATAGDPEDLIAATGLRVEPSAPIAPGETVELRLSATDPVWETERLALLIHDPDSRFGGLLLFYDDAGKRHVATVGGPMLPSFRLAAR